MPKKRALQAVSELGLELSVVWEVGVLMGDLSGWYAYMDTFTEERVRLEQLFVT